MQNTFDPKTKIITTTIGTLIETTQTFDEWYARKFVCEHLSYNGPLYKKVLNESERQHCWTLADGFGPGWTIEDIASKLEYDWSHIRDSSPAAFKEMAEYILRQHYAGPKEIAACASEWYETCRKHNCNPINPAEKMEF